MGVASVRAAAGARAAWPAVDGMDGLSPDASWPSLDGRAPAAASPPGARQTPSALLHQRAVLAV